MVWKASDGPCLWCDLLRGSRAIPLPRMGGGGCNPLNPSPGSASDSLLCSSTLSNEERKNIVRKFKSNQRKREIYNKYNDHYLQLERAKKKQRYSLMDRAKKEELLETCAKKYKEIDESKKKQMLENRRKKYKEMDASKKKQMLNRKAVKSRKRKISKLHVDVCIMESRIPLGPGKFHVVVLVLLSNLTWRRAHVTAWLTGMDPNVKICIYGDCNAMLLFSYISENRLLFCF